MHSIPVGSSSSNCIIGGREGRYPYNHLIEFPYAPSSQISQETFQSTMFCGPYIQCIAKKFSTKKKTNNSIRPLTAQLRIPRILGELILTDLRQLLAPQPTLRLGNRRPQLIQRGRDIRVELTQEIGGFLQAGLEAEAEGIIALQQLIRAVDARGQVLDVEADETVAGARVAAHGEELRVLERHGEGVAGRVGDRVVVHQVALVPVVRDLLVPGGVDEVVGRVARHAVEGFEDVAREQTLGVFLGFVGHEAVDEGPGCGLGDHAGERGVEEVRVVVDGLGEAGAAVFGQDVEVDGVAVLLAEVVELLELGELEEVVVADLVEVTSGWRGVSLVLIVGAREALRSAEEAAKVQQTVDGASNGVGCQVSIEDGTIDGKEGCNVGPHSESGLSAIDEILYRSNAIVGHVAVVCHGIQARTWSTLVGSRGSNKSVVAGVADILLTCVEWGSDTGSLTLGNLTLCKGTAGLCLSLSFLFREGASSLKLCVF